MLVLHTAPVRVSTQSHQLCSMFSCRQSVLGGCLQALEAIPRNLRSMYVHAYQVTGHPAADISAMLACLCMNAAAMGVCMHMLKMRPAELCSSIANMKGRQIR